MTSVSTSNWLDRLRSSRGFPTGTEPDLDRFLSTTTSSSANSATATRSESTHESTRPQHHDHNDHEEWLIPNILSELFNMGPPPPQASRTFSRKAKASRKQSNPRFFNGNEMCSSSGDNNNNNNSNNNNNNNITINSNVDEREQQQQEQGDDDGDDEDGDLKAYSRSDVMVIDTSLPNWKFDGWVFRKNDEWKIKEKKRYFNGGKNRKKKRELLLNEDHKNNSKDKAKSLIDKKVEPFKEAADYLSKAPQKKFPCPRPPEKFPKEGSSVILLKSIPLNNVYDGTTKLGKSARKKPPKKMKFV